MSTSPTQPPPGPHGAENANNGSDTQLDIAVIGGGIVGLMISLGLLHRNMRVTIYERAPAFNDFSTGFAFTGIARQCMQRLSPHIVDALRRVNDWPHHEYYRYWDGHTPDTKEAALMFRMPSRELDYCSCVRSQFLRGMLDRLPEGVLRYGKQLVSYVDEEGSGKVVLSFADGTEAEADVVVGCDGIHSRTRQILLGEDKPEAYAGFTHKVAYRGVVPIEGVIAALGEDKADNQCSHMGPNGHVVS